MPTPRLDEEEHLMWFRSLLLLGLSRDMDEEEELLLVEEEREKEEPSLHRG